MLIFRKMRMMRIPAMMLYLLGASRKEAAELVGMPEESVKTVLRRMFRDGFPALRDRRLSKAPFVGNLLPSPLQVSARREGEDCIVDFGINDSTLKYLPSCTGHFPRSLNSST